MAQSATIDTAEGAAKKVYGKIQDMIPSKDLKVLKRIKYDSSREVGLDYNEQVYLTQEFGFTAGGSSGARRNLNDAVVATSKNATLAPTSTHFRTEAVIELLAQVESKGPKAMEPYVGAMFRNSKKAMDRRLEVKYTLGGSPIGVVSSATDVVTTTVCTIATGKWAPGVWLGSKGMPVDMYDGSTQLNTNAALIVSVVDMKLKKITFTGNAADIDAVVAAGANTDIYYRGYYGLDGTGLRAIANLSASSGNYLGIATGTYTDVWNATQVAWDVSATDFNWDLLNTGIEEAASRGAMGDMIALVPFNVWSDLCGSLDALRAIDSSYSANKQDMGHDIDSLSYHSLCGKITIEPSAFCLNGDVICYPDPAGDSDVAIIGSSKPTFELPGAEGGKFMQPIRGVNAIEYGMFECSGLWLPNPRGCILFTT